MKNLEVSGIVNSMGEFARSQEEIASNQAEYLKAQLISSARFKVSLESEQATLEAAAKAGMDLEKYQALATSQAELYDKALASAKGQLVASIQAAMKLTAEFTKQASEINAAADAIRRENNIAIIELELDSTNLRKSIADTIRDLQIEGLQLDIDIAKAKADVGEMSEKDAADYSYSKQLEIHELRVQAENQNYLNTLHNLEVESQLLQAKFDNDIANLS